MTQQNRGQIVYTGIVNICIDIVTVHGIIGVYCMRLYLNNCSVKTLYVTLPYSSITSHVYSVVNIASCLVLFAVLL